MDKPVIVRCDDEDPMAALRAIHGQRVEGFVLDHDQTGDAPRTVDNAVTTPDLSG